MLDVAPGTLVVYGDIACPWSHLCVHGLRTARTRLGLDDGRARGMVTEQRDEAERIGTKGSPHVYAPDGSDVANPGIEKHWEGEEGEGFPVIDAYDSAVYDDLITRAASR